MKFQVFLQCAPICVDKHADEWKSFILPIKRGGKRVTVQADDPELALSLAKEQFPQFGSRLMVQ